MSKIFRYISPDYLDTQKYLHEQPKGYGGRGDKWAPAIYSLMKKYGCKSVLDYGCGQGTLAKSLRKLSQKIYVGEYDPAIQGKNFLPDPRDLVVCTDVMEHIEPDKLGVVIDHIFRLTNIALFLVIATRPSKKFLKDGRNSHLIIEPDSWWKERFTHPHFHFAEEVPKSPLEVPSREWISVLVRNDPRVG